MTFIDTLRGHAVRTEQYFEQRFDQNPEFVPPKLLQAAKYSVLNGGKRFRPFLVLEAAKLFGISEEKAIPAAAALECIHCYSLVHDDLPAMDDDQLRRGKPTVHIAFDEATAILTGDGLLTYAFEILSENNTHPDPIVRLNLVSHMAKAAGIAGMVGGQSLDIEAEKQNDISLDGIKCIQSLKTGAIIKYACLAGGLLGQADSKQQESLIGYGEKLGLAFQIADDLLDIKGNTETVGKKTSKDTEAGKATIVSLMGVEAAEIKLKELEEEAIQKISIFGDHATTLIEAAKFVTNRDH